MKREPLEVQKIFYAIKNIPTQIDMEKRKTLTCKRKIIKEITESTIEQNLQFRKEQLLTIEQNILDKVTQLQKGCNFATQQQLQLFSRANPIKESKQYIIYMNLYNDQLFNKQNTNLFFSITNDLSINKLEVIGISDIIEKTMQMKVTHNDQLIWKAHSLFSNKINLSDENNIDPIYLRNKIIENMQLMRYLHNQNPTSSVIENKIIKQVTFQLLNEYKLEFQLVRNDQVDLSANDPHFFAQIYQKLIMNIYRSKKFTEYLEYLKFFIIQNYYFKQSKISNIQFLIIEFGKKVSTNLLHSINYNSKEFFENQPKYNRK